MTCFYESNGKVFAILNYQLRKDESDAMVTMPLDTREMRVFSQLTEKGADEREIFHELFPSRVPEAKPAKSTSPKVSIGIDQLNKRQLVHILHEELKTTMKSLPNLTTNDLRKLLAAVKVVEGE